METAASIDRHTQLQQKPLGQPCLSRGSLTRHTQVVLATQERRQSAQKRNRVWIVRQSNLLFRFSPSCLFEISIAEVHSPAGWLACSSACAAMSFLFSRCPNLRRHTSPPYDWRLVDRVCPSAVQRNEDRVTSGALAETAYRQQNIELSRPTLEVTFLSINLSGRGRVEPPSTWKESDHNRSSANPGKAVHGGLVARQARDSLRGIGTEPVHEW